MCVRRRAGRGVDRGECQSTRRGALGEAPERRNGSGSRKIKSQGTERVSPCAAARKERTSWVLSGTVVGGLGVEVGRAWSGTKEELRSLGAERNETERRRVLPPAGVVAGLERLGRLGRKAKRC